MYKIIKYEFFGTVYESVMRYNEDGSTTSIPYEPANTDYENFKSQINNGSAQLEDANGVLMTPTQVKAYVATLP